jgi:hypothetical protein
MAPPAEMPDRPGAAMGSAVKPPRSACDRQAPLGDKTEPRPKRAGHRLDGPSRTGSPRTVPHNVNAASHTARPIAMSHVSTGSGVTIASGTRAVADQGFARGTIRDGCSRRSRDPRAAHRGGGVTEALLPRFDRLYEGQRCREIRPGRCFALRGRHDPRSKFLRYIVAGTERGGRTYPTETEASASTHPTPAIMTYSVTMPPTSCRSNRRGTIAVTPPHRREHRSSTTAAVPG